RAAFCDENGAFTFPQLRRAARGVGSALAALPGGVMRKPVAVFESRRVETVAAMLGVLYAGGFYVALDPELPKERLEAILGRVRPAAAIRMEEAPVEMNGPVLAYAGAAAHAEDDPALEAAARDMTDQDPVQVLFTSGSTG